MIIKNNKTFHLQGRNISYIIAINEVGDLLHYYFGEKLADRDYSKKLTKSGYGLLCNDENAIFLETEAQEYPAYGYIYYLTSTWEKDHQDMFLIYLLMTKFIIFSRLLMH